MNKVIGSLVAQFKDFYKNLGPTKKLSVVVASIIILVAVIVISLMLGARSYAPLFTNVPSDQVSFLVQKLNEKNIPFQLKDEGKTILIPQEFLYSTQMSLMAEVGSNRMGNVGLELFEKQDFGISSFSQKVNYQRAIQGELIRAINTLTAVKQSKVILSLPNKKTFLEESGTPSASVVVELYPSKTLSAEQVKGIQYLVANAVEGMDFEKVTVLDERGKMLSRSKDGSLAGSTELLDMKSQVESQIEDRIEGMLSRVVGQAKVIAKVDATLNHKVITAVEEAVDPEKTAVLSQSAETELLDGARTNPAGVPGSRANLPGAEDASQVGFKQNVSKELKTTNYQVPKTVRNVKENAGSLERLSVAVLVDGYEQVITKEDGATEKKWVARTPDEIKQYEDLVKNAVGFNVARGDTVKIENIRFVPEDFTESERLLTSLERRKMLYGLLKWGLLAFGVALFFFLVVRPFMQWMTDSFQDSVEDMLPRTIEELEELHSIDNTLPGMTSAMPVLEESIDPDKAESELLKDRIIAIMEQDGEKAGNAFGMWLVRKDH